MRTVLLVSNALLLLLLIVAVRRMLNYRSRLGKLGQSYRAQLKAMKGTFDSVIPLVRLDEFHEVFAQTGLGFNPESEVSFIGCGVTGGTSYAESWVLSVLAKQATFLFEFGTCSGKTTYLWAKNSPAEARIITLTLGKDQHADYLAAGEDNFLATRTALAESALDSFIYSGTPVEHKITQLFGDSKRFDETPYLKQCDLIFIDGSHAYSYVKNDTEKALRMLKEGGLLLWHDYRYNNVATRGVRRYLDELSETLPLVRLDETCIVAYRSDTNKVAADWRAEPGSISQ
jgi:predicted O-methyltransferase YrrM